MSYGEDLDLGSEPPAHDYNMPHDSTQHGYLSCPPNCPYLLWHKRIYAKEADLGGMAGPEREAAFVFMKACGLTPTSDAIGQLTEAFLPCLKIMCERGYDPNGATWRAEGWRGMLWKIRDKSDRLWFHGWRQGRFVIDHPHDMMNYAGYYARLGHQGQEWGARGEPGRLLLPPFDETEVPWDPE